MLKSSELIKKILRNFLEPEKESGTLLLKSSELIKKVPKEFGNS